MHIKRGEEKIIVCVIHRNEGKNSLRLMTWKDFKAEGYIQRLGNLRRTGEYIDTEFRIFIIDELCEMPKGIPPVRRG